MVFRSTTLLNLIIEIHCFVVLSRQLAYSRTMSLCNIRTHKNPRFRSEIAVFSEFQCLWTRTVPGVAAENWKC